MCGRKEVGKREGVLVGAGGGDGDGKGERDERLWDMGTCVCSRKEKGGGGEGGALLAKGSVLKEC